ncbi:hypothetical protein LCGC14_3084080, partial [marine sediment metagenome]
RQSLDLDAKVAMSVVRIRQWYDHWDGLVYVAFSGGLDSTVLKHIVESVYPDVPSAFCDTTLEFPEIRRFVKSCGNVTVIRPKMTFADVIERYGYPVVNKTVAQYIEEVKRAKGETATKDDETETHSKEQLETRAAHSKWLAFGEGSMSELEIRSLSQDKNDEGGYLSPDEVFVNQLIQKVDDAVFMRQFGTTHTLTNADSIAVGDSFRIGIRRDIDDGDDTATGDFALTGIELQDDG